MHSRCYLGTILKLVMAKLELTGFSPRSMISMIGEAGKL